MSFDPSYQEEESLKNYRGKPKDYKVAIKEISLTLELMDHQMENVQRDIDDSSWLMMYINYLASKDLYILESIHRNLKYTDWDEQEKKQFLEYYFNPAFGPDHPESMPGALQKIRMEMFQEIKYLVEYSALLKDFPWIIRSIFDEKSEFSYWYVMYTAKSINPLWVDKTILPALLTLISEDEITPVTYLWLKRPESLKSMEEEILRSGYPWTSLFEIIKINNEIYKVIERLYQQGEKKPGGYAEGIFL